MQNAYLVRLYRLGLLNKSSLMFDAIRQHILTLQSIFFTFNPVEQEVHK